MFEILITIAQYITLSGIVFIGPILEIIRLETTDTTKQDENLLDNEI